MFARTLIAAALSLAAAGPVAAQTLKPIQSQRIDLGQVKGDAYYTVEQNGYRVVATFAEPGATHVPVRVEAVLAPGQTVTFLDAARCRGTTGSGGDQSPERPGSGA